MSELLHNVVTAAHNLDWLFAFVAVVTTVGLTCYNTTSGGEAGVGEGHDSGTAGAWKAPRRPCPGPTTGASS